MPRNATKSRDREFPTPAQVKVLDALLAGRTVSSAAESAGVDRSTVHRWLRGDRRFQALYNGLRHDLLAAVRAKLLQSVNAAATAVASAIEAGDVKTALTLLKGLGFLSGDRPQIGSDDPEDLNRVSKGVHPFLFGVDV